MDAPVLEVKDLVRRFGDQTAVDRVNFRIDAGETYGLLGPNGAGKTTTISMIAGLLQPDAGSVAVLGQPLTTSRKSHIGLVPQDIALYPDLSAREGMAVLYTTHYMEEAERLCDRVGIIDAGVLVAEGTRDELVRALGEKTTVSFRVNAGPEALTAWRADLEAITGVTGVLDSPDGLAVVTAEGPSLIAAAVQAAEQRRVDVVGVDVTEPDLEAVFLHLTGKALRD
ncbi:MAG: ATP-binding cassette domain-containing protein [Candidatus Nanopelagicales bacterium]|nr:ATP-binding cassette domain-containing protein [Candidatus Nanopelagicales bacterium]